MNIHIHIHHHNHGDADTNGKLNLIIQNQEQMATQFAELVTTFNELKTVITTERQQILDKLAAADQKVTDLETQLASAGSDEERANLLADLRASIQEVKDIIPDPADVPTTPEEQV